MPDPTSQPGPRRKQRSTSESAPPSPEAGTSGSAADDAADDAAPDGPTPADEPSPADAQAEAGTAAPGPEPADTAGGGGQATASVEHVVEPSKQYMIAARGAVNSLHPAEFDMFAVQLNQNIGAALESGAPGVRLIARLEGPQSPTVANDTGLPPAQDTIYLAELSDQQANNFRRNFRQAIIAEDVPVELATAPVIGGLEIPDPGLLPVMPLEDAVDLTLLIRGDGAPLAGANAYLMGSIFPAQGVSGADGRVAFKLYGERPDTLKALFVKPRADYWTLWVPRPSLRQEQTNVVDLQPLSAVYPGFPGQQVWGWGQRAMGLDRLDGRYTGQGVKIAVIDSGIQRDHPNLQVTAGRDLVTADAWGDDTVGHGTHCAGVIAARNTGSGIRGFAPDAELHAVKIFPGAQVSHLVEALNYCIENGIDVVNMSLGIPQLGPDQIELLQGKLRQARASGVACFVAAGNSAGRVQFPAVFPEVLAVAAIGQQGTFPATSYHSTQVFEDAVPGTGAIFSAKFTCFGPEVDVAAPGVAVLSAYPPRGYAAMDGTSMAAPHVTGLAALLVGHHPELHGQPRTEERVARLFNIIRGSCRRLPFPASYDQRQGAGLPDVQQALAAVLGTPGPTAGSPGSIGSTRGTPTSQPSRPSRSDLATDFPMFQGVRPLSLGFESAQAVQAELAELARFEATLAQQPAGRPQTAGADGPQGPGPQDPRLQELDDAMRSYGLLPPASGAGGGSGGRPPGLHQLDLAIQAAGLPFATPSGGSGAAGAQPSPAPSARPASEQAELQFLDTFLRDQVEGLIQQLRRYVNQYSRVSECLPLVDQAVQQFGAREYARALNSGYQALACIRSKLGG